MYISTMFLFPIGCEREQSYTEFPEYNALVAEWATLCHGSTGDTEIVQTSHAGSIPCVV